MALERLRELPIRTRRFHRESPSSFIRRAAATNGLTIAVVAAWSTQQGYFAARDRDEWLSLWSALSGTNLRASDHERAGAHVADRPLCLRCTRGISASGNYADWGLVCLRHRVWIDPDDGRLVGHEDLVAERGFRHAATQFAITVQGSEMRLALRIAAALGGRRYVDGRVGATSVPAKLFPLQVAIAVALTSMDVTSPPDPGLEASMDWIRCHVPPTAVGDEPWRAAAIVSELFRALGKVENRSERVLNDRRWIFERLAW